MGSDHCITVPVPAALAHLQPICPASLPPPFPTRGVQVRPSLAKMAVKGMWDYMQHYEAALRWASRVGGW